VTSRQALRIAKVSDDRVERESVLRASSEQARLLIDWACLHRRAAAMPYLAVVGGQRESTVSRSYRETRSTLHVSDVPGAELVFALTEHDLTTA
jgi:hypothetical protein